MTYLVLTQLNDLPRQNFYTNIPSGGKAAEPMKWPRFLRKRQGKVSPAATMPWKGAMPVKKIFLLEKKYLMEESSTKVFELTREYHIANQAVFLLEKKYLITETEDEEIFDLYSPDDLTQKLK